MKANPGGQLAPSQVIGRDELIARLWRILERQGLVMSAERRIGKTSLMKKMVDQARDDKEKLSIYHDLEGVRTRLEFVEILMTDVEEHLGRVQRTAHRLRELLTQLGGAEIAGIIQLPEMAAAHWKSLLTHTVEDLMEHQERAVIFFWDEFPLMLFNIAQQEGTTAATELLDVLRALRQTHPRLRMVFTGSVGLLNVIAGFRREGYANDPINDMYKLIVPALDREHATELARRLLEGEGVRSEAIDQLAESIAEAVDGLPYYIHHIVHRLVDEDRPVTIEVIDELVVEALTDPGDRWDLRHYLDRIRIYYGKALGPIALTLLDILAASEETRSFEEIYEEIKTRRVLDDREQVRSVLTMLERDHYLQRDPEGRIRFVYPLVRRWWRLQRS